jgi:hypothetical protein
MRSKTQINKNNGHSTNMIDPGHKVQLRTAAQERRLNSIRAAFNPEVKPNISLPKFSWDK